MLPPARRRTSGGRVPVGAARIEVLIEAVLIVAVAHGGYSCSCRARHPYGSPLLSLNAAEAPSACVPKRTWCLAPVRRRDGAVSPTPQASKHAPVAHGGVSACELLDPIHGPGADRISFRPASSGFSAGYASEVGRLTRCTRAAPAGWPTMAKCDDGRCTSTHRSGRRSYSRWNYALSRRKVRGTRSGFPAEGSPPPFAPGRVLFCAGGRAKAVHGWAGAFQTGRVQRVSIRLIVIRQMRGARSKRNFLRPH